MSLLNEARWSRLLIVYKHFAPNGAKTGGNRASPILTIIFNLAILSRRFQKSLSSINAAIVHHRSARRLRIISARGRHLFLSEPFRPKTTDLSRLCGDRGGGRNQRWS